MVFLCKCVRGCVSIVAVRRFCIDGSVFLGRATSTLLPLRPRKAKETEIRVCLFVEHSGNQSPAKELKT